MQKTIKILAISGSVREQSTNTYLLEFLKENAPENFEIEIFGDLKKLPIFSIDDVEQSPVIIRTLLNKVKNCDAILISCPEYIHSIPGGLKNLIDWLVPNEEIIDKHIFLAHASHRGEDLLDQLRLVLKTASNNFHENIFIRFGIMNKSRDEIFKFLSLEENNKKVKNYFERMKKNFSKNEAV